MTGEQSRHLAVGDRVCWHGDQSDRVRPLHHARRFDGAPRMG
jgi:hypothetical protein